MGLMFLTGFGNSKANVAKGQNLENKTRREREREERETSFRDGFVGLLN